MVRVPPRPLFDDAAEPAIVVGLISGTSADGVDAACCRLARPDGAPLRWQLLATASIPYPEALAARLRAPERLTVPQLAGAHAEVGAVFAEAARAVADAARISLAGVDLIGSHGQTVWHDPRAEHDRAPVSLQIGEAAEIAERTGRPVWYDFRPADVAAGGEGAPFVPYVDWLLFTDPSRWRACLNLGGIANVTILRPGARQEDVVAFDTGPGNMLLDLLARRLLDAPRDEAGARARSGKVDRRRLEAALGDPYFAMAAPKSTGRERFGEPFLRRHFEPLADLSDEEVSDRFATAAALTVESVARALEGSAGPPPLPADAEVVVAGGGRRNRALMAGLAERCAPRPFVAVEERGLDGDFKEAAAFAILAYESALGRCVNMPTVTGARHSARCGKLAYPPPVDEISTPVEGSTDR
jgi:anhydro-N-acetylmuramic acid kinase